MPGDLEQRGTQRRAAGVDRVIPLQVERRLAGAVGRGGIAADDHVLGDVHAEARVEVLEAAGVERRVDAGEVDVRPVRGSGGRDESQRRSVGLLRGPVAAAEEKYCTPCAATSSTASLIGPSPKNGSSSEPTSSTITSARHFPSGSASARMLFAKPRSPVLAVAKHWRAAGAMSCDDLQHRAALVGAGGVLEHGHALRREIAAADVVGGVDGQRLAVDGLGGGVEGVRERADGDAAPGRSRAGRDRRARRRRPATSPRRRA